MRGLGVVTEWFERGAAIVSRMYAKRFAEQFRVRVFARGEGILHPPSPDDQEYGATWGRYDPLNPTYVNERELVRWVRRNRIEILFFNEQHDWNIVHAIREALPDVCVGSYIDYYTQATVPLFRLYDFLICNTRRHFEVFRGHPQCSYVSWGTEVDVYTPGNGGGRPGVVFFHSCGMNPYRKGTEAAIKAFAGLPAGCGAEFVIHTQVPLAKYVDAAAQDILRTNRGITVHERTVPAPGLYQLGDVYVYPTRLDGVGLSVVEALASGLPVIAPDAAPMNEFVVPDETGSLVPVDRYVSRADGYYWPECEVSVPAITQAMGTYVERAGSLPAMRASVRAKAVQLYDWGSRTEICDIVQRAKIIRHDLWRNTDTQVAFARWRDRNPNQFSTALKRVVWHLLPYRMRRAAYARLRPRGY